jgi:hypothetical protein
MRYMFVNANEGALQIDLHHPDKSTQRKKLHRMGPEVALCLGRGESVDILPYFGGSLELAHASVKFSSDVVKTIRPDKLQIYVCDDSGEQIDVEKLLSDKASKVPVAPKVPETRLVPPGRQPEENAKPADITKPAMEVAEVLAANDQFEAKKRGEANEPKTFKKYRREDLEHMNKKELVKVATKLGIMVDKNSTKEELVDIIAGA